MATVFASLLAGLVFGLGLIVSGMANPAKVLGFLELGGAWDPSLAFVMAGAIAVAAFAFALAKRRTVSFLGVGMKLPASRDIDRRLVIGSVLFGVGWGVAGFCPGPGLVALGMGEVKATVFVAAMLLGMGLFADVAVIDSIQTVYSEALQSAPGSVAQVRECAAQLTRFAKQSNTAIILVGHVTKEGALAGPRVLEHIVDTVLYFEGDSNSSFRLVRAFKNRFGAVNELGVFAMTEKGLREVSNPSALFLSHHGQEVAGSCVMVTQEGTRPLLVEIQALVDEAHAPNPRRLSVGLEQNRLAMLLAVLHRHAGISCFDQDVFVNAVGGVKIVEPAADLAVLLAIVSSLRNKPLPGKFVVFGEVGLAGEIRPVQRGQERLKEAAKLGFTLAVVPRANKPKQNPPGLEVVAVERLEEAVAFCRERA